jgi:hypothetical protein
MIDALVEMVGREIECMKRDRVADYARQYGWSTDWFALGDSDPELEFQRSWGNDEPAEFRRQAQSKIEEGCGSVDFCRKQLLPDDWSLEPGEFGRAVQRCELELLLRPLAGHAKLVVARLGAAAEEASP